MSKETPQPLKIFLSYGHHPPEHVEVAERIKSDLEARGHSVWFDLEKLRVRHDWEVEIEAAIAKADTLLLLMTPYSVRRSGAGEAHIEDGFCLNEIAKAIQLGKPVVPVMLAWVAQGPPLSICRLQWLDLQDCVPLSERYDIYKNARYPQLVDALENNFIEREGEWSNLYENLRPLDFGVEIKRHIASFTGREWLIGSNGFITRWLRHASGSRVFWLLGGPGVGKTSIATYLAHHVGEVAAVHFCVHRNKDFVNCRKMILSIVYQIATRLKSYRDFLINLDFSDEATKDPGTLFRNLLTGPLAKLQFDRVDTDSCLFIVIDGLDEATVNGNNEIAALLGSQWADMPPWIRLFITSRKDYAVVEQLRHLEPFELETTSGENKEDIRRYVDSAFRNNPLLDFDENVIDKVATKSEGLFLYAEQLMLEIQSNRIDPSKPDSFPDGLNGIYLNFFRRVFDCLQVYENDAKPILESISAARGPLPIALLAIAVGKSEFELRKSLLTLGGFLEFDNNSVSLYHKSIIDWLTDRHLAAGRYAIDIEMGRRAVLSACFADLEKHAPDSANDYTIRNLVAHYQECGNFCAIADLLCDMRWIKAKLNRTGIDSILDDFLLYKLSSPSSRDHVSLIGNALRLSRTAIVRDATQIEAQLYARLLENRNESIEISTFLEHLQGNCKSRWLKAIRPGALEGPGSATLKTIQNVCSIACAAYSPESQIAAFAGGDGGVVISGPHETHPIPPSEAGNDLPKDLRISSDGKFISVLMASGSVLVISTETKTLVSKIIDDESKIIASTFVGSTSCRVLLKRGLVYTFDFKKQEKSSESVISGKILTNCGISPDGRTLCTTDSAGALHVVKDASIESERLDGYIFRGVTLLAISDRAKRVAVYGREGHLRIFDFSTGVELRSVPPLKDPATTVTFSSDGELFLAGYGDGRIRAIEVESGRETYCFRPHFGQVTAVCLDLEARQLISASTDRTMKFTSVWETGDRDPCSGHECSVTAVAFSLGGELVVTGDVAGALIAWDTRRGGKKIKEFCGHRGEVTAISFTRSGFLITGSDDRKIRIWNVDDSSLVGTLEGHCQRLIWMAVSPDGRQLVSASSDGDARVWDLRTFKLRHQFSRGTDFREFKKQNSWLNPEHRSKMLSALPSSLSLSFKPDAPAIWAKFEGEETLVAFGDASGRVGIFEVTDASA